MTRFPIIVQEAQTAQLSREPLTMALIAKAQEGRDIERDGLAQELAVHYGAVYVDDDCEVVAMTTRALCDMMAVLGFRTRKELAEKYGPAVSVIKGAMRAREDEGSGP